MQIGELPPPETLEEADRPLRQGQDQTGSDALSQDKGGQRGEGRW